MDEGGDSETLALTALSVTGPVHEIENRAEELAGRLVAMLGLPDDFELHGVALLRDARLRPFQREFVFRQAIVYDKLSQQPHLEREHRLWAEETGGDRILVSPRFDDSKGVRLLQLADIAAHAVHLCARRPDTTAVTVGGRRRGRSGRRHADTQLLERAIDDPARTWYTRHLQACFPAAARHSGLRRVDL